MNTRLTKEELGIIIRALVVYYTKLFNSGKTPSSVKELDSVIQLYDRLSRENR